jgi:hypothetical protein
MKDRRTKHLQYSRPNDYVWPFIAAVGLLALAFIIWAGV